ncbi:MAG: hypothetical protein ACJ71R_06635 [Nitrososphaeraceae archaeon]
MTEDQYGFIIENIIANSNHTLNFTQIYDRVCCQFCPTVSKKTIRRWLTRLEEGEIMTRDDRDRRYNEVYYSITPARIFERKFFGAGSSLNPEPALHNEGQQQALEKAYVLILLQAALGTEIPQGNDEPVLGAVYGYNPATGMNECLTSEKLRGATINEVLEHRNIGLGGLFDHLNFTQLLQKDDCVKIIQKVLGLKDNTIARIDRNGEIAIEIVEDTVSMTQLKNFIKNCACMIFWVHSRLSDTIAVSLLNALYKDRNLTGIPPASFFSNLELEAFKSYLSLYGRKELNYQFKLCKEKVDKLTENVVTEIQGSKNTIKKQLSKNAIKKKMRELIEKRKGETKQTDKNIIALYYGLIKCEIYVDAPVLQKEEEKYHRYERYYNYVKRDMPKEYRHLIDILMKVIYPRFLQKYHSTNPKLVDFKESLPPVML